MLLILRFALMKNPIGESYLMNAFSNASNPLEWVQATLPPAYKNPENSTQVISNDAIVFSLFAQRNISNEEQESLHTWNLLKHLIDQAQFLPNGVEAIKEAGNAWNSLMASIEEERRGIPNGLLGNFRIDLTGEALPGEPDPPIILHYNVRLHGDKITEDPVIVQNTWTVAHDWGEEARCPSPTPEKMDELDQCNKIVGRNDTLVASLHSKGSRRSSMVQDGSKRRRYFPFKQGYLSVATLRVGSEGIQMTVDGKYITSFAYRETLEPWLVSEVRISGDLKLISVVASGLPTSEDSERTVDLEALKSVPLSPRKPPHLFIGVFSTANNFKRRMAVRRTWMQYAPVRSGTVAVRFFVGLEWPEEKYPPWAHGPGYVVSGDIAKEVYRRYKEGRLKIFKLEDVAMGIWINQMEKEGLKIRYENNERIYNEGCKDGYIVAHYQGPREMLCLWQKLQEGNVPRCCGDR
ncbi:hypothetical protein GH714_028343 [Hevea brasiliensis]|uniref:Hexosyltransferase n=1 Tax=Hevea brasiliensis TaxID=3981 RepID=A0A6A6LEF1_HEVBR|nr:hypothetical protein GH714_028343 [Hevea brasiliensis]